MARTWKFFAYGANMNVGYLKNWLSQRGARPDGIKAASRATLHGFCLEFNGPPGTSGGAQANLVENPSGRVEGVLYEVDDLTLAKLEQKEGVPRQYERRKVAVTDPDGKRIADVVTFWAPLPRCAPGRPAARYLQWMLDGAQAFELPQSWLDEVRRAAEGSSSAETAPSQE